MRAACKHNNLIDQTCLSLQKPKFSRQSEPQTCYKAWASNMRFANRIFVALSRTIFPTDIFLNLGNLSLAPDYVSHQIRVENTLIFRSLSLQNRKLNSRNHFYHQDGKTARTPLAPRLLHVIIPLDGTQCSHRADE